MFFVFCFSHISFPLLSRDGNEDPTAKEGSSVESSKYVFFMFIFLLHLTYSFRTDSTSTEEDTETGKLAVTENKTYIVSIHFDFILSFISLLLVVPTKMSR